MDNFKVGDYLTSCDDRNIRIHEATIEIDVDITGTYGEEDWKVKISNKTYPIGIMPIEILRDGVFEPKNNSFQCKNSILNLDFGPLNYILLDSFSFSELRRITDISRNTDGKVKFITVSGTPDFYVTITVFYGPSTSEFFCRLYYDFSTERIEYNSVIQHLDQ
ncbi:MAG: hypothetical protein AAB966_03190 [Patescibacteria group bacterium]